ncbi:von Hippel-Lindau disease tumor suppressor [Venturia canescens]|uniref:von Hippel-Lindau disease tumor suppressor n=1 Tax=Venturia canescens TaxID=32260 RepID=UPI001C9CEE6F|nr:von Hippel-Lindau disease tumor suppressor [Venturia canescens]
MGTREEASIIRSINTDHPSWVLFFNTTKHRIEILWINYEGQAVSYGILGPQESLSMKTFATHPWIFVKKETMERFMVAGKDVFYPKAWKPSPGYGPTRQIMPFVVCIALPMYTLREIAMRAIKSLLQDDNDAYLLDIPKNLQHELANLTPRKSRQI